MRFSAARMAPIAGMVFLGGCVGLREDPAVTRRYLVPIEWQLDPGNPVIAPGQYHSPHDDMRVSCCSVVELGETYRMYYWAEDANHHYTIAALECPVDQPNAWKPLGVVLERQPDKPHNSQGPCYAQVLPQSNGSWIMYVNTWGAARADGKLPYQTNIALSEDKGITWHYYRDEPFLPLTEWWNREGTGSVCVISDGGLFRAYFTALSDYVEPPPSKKNEMFHAGFLDKVPSIGIGYAESTDGLNWHYPLDNWLVPPRHYYCTPYEYALSKPWVVRDGSGYRMWCSANGIRYRIRSLTSPDAIHWTFHDEWVFDDTDDPVQDGVGPPGSFDNEMRSYPCVQVHGDEYRMWYTGNWFGEVGEGNYTGIGYAVGRLCPGHVEE